MSELFGIPMSTLMWVFTIALGTIVVWSLFLVVRQPVLFRMAARNIPRRFGRSMLIVLGLTLATTIITTAMATGDTITHTVRVYVLDSLGNADEIVSSTEEGNIEITGESSQIDYFDEAHFEKIRQALADSADVDGVMPVIWEAVAVQDLTTRQTEPRVHVMAADHRHMQGFGTIYDSSGKAFDFASLAAGEVLINQDASEELKASAGDELALYAGGKETRVKVREVVDYKGIGAGATDSALMMSLSDGQKLFDKAGLIKHVLISNRGNAESGATHTDSVIARVEPTLSSLGLAVEPTKRDDLKAADQAGADFSMFFVTFGSFSIFAGVLLIFLLFVMLAGERKPEMGIARAVGTERIHLVEMFMFEGLLYDVAAAAVGALFGVAIAYGMILALSAALANFELDIEFSVSGRSLLTAYAMGVVLSFIVVTISAWRVSVLNIVTAIRDLPDPAAKRGGRASLIWGVVALLLGALLTWSGVSASQATPFYLGVSLILLSFVPLLRWLGVADRLAFSVAGGLIVVYSLLPFDTMEPLVGEMAMDFNIWVASGLITVIGVTWVAMYNSDLFLGLVMKLGGSIRALTPILKTAITYPLTNKFRTGVTLAMFTIVVFVLVVGMITTTAFTDAFDDVELYGGGFDIRVNTVQANPVADLGKEIGEHPLLDPDDYEVIAEHSLVAIEAKQTDSSREFGAYPLRGVDDAFLDNTSFGFAALATGYETSSQVWQALKSNPNLAVVDDLVAPRRNKFGFGDPVPDFMLEGFYVEDGSFDPITIQVRDPLTGVERDLTVIAVLKDIAPPFMIGVITSQRLVDEAFPEQATPTTHLMRLKDGVDPEAVSDNLEASFLPNGLEATILSDELHDLVNVNRTFNYLIQGFIGLGLLVGVAALGVVSARNVVERRQEIGVMRAIGFEQGRVQLSFLIEASMVAVAGIVLGTVLGLILAFNVITDSRQEASWENLKFTVPWLNLIVIYGIVMVAALATAWVPARQASRVYPAEALRYE